VRRRRPFGRLIPIPARPALPCSSGYFAFTARTMAQSTSVRSQMWKMYSLSDSRYITADTFTVLMEGCTAVRLAFRCLHATALDGPGVLPSPWTPRTAADAYTPIRFPFAQVFWGPLSLLLAVHLIPARSPFRHPAQLAVSLGQLYGLVLYWGIPIIDESLKGPIAAVSRPGAILCVLSQRGRSTSEELN